MHTAIPQLADLFEQLGLPSSQADIQKFVREHRPLPDDLKLTDASFWTESQASFLREQIRLDAEWAMPIDSLNVQLRTLPVTAR